MEQFIISTRIQLWFKMPAQHAQKKLKVRMKVLKADLAMAKISPVSEIGLRRR